MDTKFMAFTLKGTLNKLRRNKAFPTFQSKIRSQFNDAKTFLFNDLGTLYFAHSIHSPHLNPLCDIMRSGVEFQEREGGEREGGGIERDGKRVIRVISVFRHIVSVIVGFKSGRTSPIRWAPFQRIHGCDIRDTSDQNASHLALHRKILSNLFISHQLNINQTLGGERCQSITFHFEYLQMHHFISGVDIYENVDTRFHWDALTLICILNG